MLLFSWKKVFYYSQGKPSEIVRIIRMMTYEELPLNKKDKIYKYSNVNFAGESFLLHPEVLLFNAYQYSQKDVAVYIALAALRSSAAYLAHGVLTLDLLHCPVNPLDHLENPNLLPIENDKIHFLYEEVDNQTKH